MHENRSNVYENGLFQCASYADITLFRASKYADMAINLDLVLANPELHVNIQDVYGATALIKCCEVGDKALPIVKKLIGLRQLEVNITDVYGKTALFACCKKGDKSLQIVKTLLLHPKINVGFDAERVVSSLIWCCWVGDKSLSIAKALIGHKKTRINERNRGGCTALDKIIQHILSGGRYYKYTKIWRLMVKHGGVLSHCKTDYFNLNPLDFKEPQRGYIKIIKKHPPKNRRDERG